MLAMFTGCMAMGVASAAAGLTLGPGASVPGMAPAVGRRGAGDGGGAHVRQLGAAVRRGALPTSTTSVVMLSEVLFASLSSWLLASATWRRARWRAGTDHAGFLLAALRR